MVFYLVVAHADDGPAMDRRDVALQHVRRAAREAAAIVNRRQHNLFSQSLLPVRLPASAVPGRGSTSWAAAAAIWLLLVAEAVVTRNAHVDDV